MDSLQKQFADFFKRESTGGILLIISALAAIILANSPLEHYYNLLISTPVQVRVGALDIAKPLLLWVNDGMMAIFFLLVGLELKREVLRGELSQLSNMVLPGLGAVGGMLVPALFYLIFNWQDPAARQGWAVPAATDIAFALGVLSLLGSRVPTSVKVFLTSLAIFDDIGAILIIALFYTSNISLGMLIVAGLCLVGLFFINRFGVQFRSPYFMLGLIMWIALLKSGVHATLAGVLLALFIPIRENPESGVSLLYELEHELHGLVAYAILPLFAFANSGINLRGIGFDFLLHGVPVGIAVGLFLGKQLGIFAFCWAGIKLGLTRLPNGMNQSTLYGTAILCGIGFTMSLFIGSLAFEETGTNQLFDERLGIIIGSLLSGVVGFLVLKKSLPKE
ncbi:sodium/proton antiporter, NhaA family (TC 2.A.33.1.1) [Malonomonas rubra DSM 5091]|uniref:Na(+)/H(+) antiporter NhaA n=1 Tax=Malonomonas rubra DSM 5091 TaxID=1122189 RepID=A0A1M6H700_MALRU|nr:Na+/H+ antiporter NhaA [Malonomonas rubra]SHJ17944.1 sodium/proton antiporter, NhaA family (TC 2.A.33.1.1) [Malonomonas rubra DSM 5091]